MNPELFDITVLISNAGKALRRDDVGQIAERDTKEMFNTNFLAHMMLTQEVLIFSRPKILVAS